MPYMRDFSENLKTRNYALHVLPKFSDWVYETAFLKDNELLKTVEKTKQKSLAKIKKYSNNANISFESDVLEGIASEEHPHIPPLD